ncbi:MAG: type II toxin-antitoxin system RelE/ParE family toxin [Planctomycetes bacterium]|nr:type II toxin-antitoxin system RelE/ParE family toxin [Planctomycetota bacterium]
MSARIRRHPQALLDLEHTATWLGADDAAVALRVLDAVERTVRWLAAHPELGRARELRHAWLRGVRSFPVGGFEKHLVLYRPVADGIEVLRVRHGARDLLEEPDDSPER